MDDDSRVIDRGWDTLPSYGDAPGDDAVTVSIAMMPGEWLVNTIDAVVVPMSMAEVVEALRSHKLNERSLVWRAGMQEWATVENVPQLRLAARLPASAGAKPAPPRPAPSKPEPMRSSESPSSVPSASTPPQAFPSRMGTLPFGLTAPLVGSSRPSTPRPSPLPRRALPPAAAQEEPEALAVYARPAATVSFDLPLAKPLRTTPSSAPTALQTLAPTTTDSAQRRAEPLNAELSVVAAHDFRQAQRSSQRVVLLSSLASAAAASLLTLALSRGGAPSSAAPAGERGVAVPVAPPVAPAPVAVAPPLEAARPVTEEPAAINAERDAKTEVSPAKPKPKPARRVKVVAPRAARPEVEPTRDPVNDPNPYGVKLEEDAPAAKTPDGKAPAAARGSGLEVQTSAPEGSTSANTPSPGF